jgi:hypothetical protein
MRDRPPGLLPRIFAGQSHYPDYLLRGEGGRRSGARLVGEHLFDHLRDEEDTITFFFFFRCLLLRFLLGGYETWCGLQPARTPSAHLFAIDVQKLGYSGVIGARGSGLEDNPRPAHQLLRTSLAALKAAQGLSLSRCEYDRWWFGTAHDDESSPPLGL